MADAEEVELEEEEQEECPKCPPVGAPAWMATFADMATLLMAFFVLILSFAEFNVPKFKQISGSLKNAFGVQKVIPVVEQPKGTTVIEMNFSPSPSPSVTEEMTQQTTQQEQREVEIKSKDKDAENGNDLDNGGTDAESGSGYSSENLTATQLADALQDAIEKGQVELQSDGEQVVVNFPENENTEKDLPSLLQETLAALDEASAATGESEGVLFGGLEQQLKDLFSKISEQESQIKELSNLASGAGDDGDEDKKAKASIATDLLEVALRQEIADGLVEVERRDGKVFVTVGSGGAFPSGTADLTSQAQEIIQRISFNALTSSSKLTVTGHTDNVPISGGLYRDNWDLAAARAASVVQAVQNTGMVAASNLQAVSKGENDPVASNDTAAGRELNRRIEIEIDY
ncbi:flagellar motor protein [Rhodobacteraceae bacterium HIMB11]|nr:flagellar motor protein [Rhodobacteraceae bacterium HIMB11]